MTSTTIARRLLPVAAILAVAVAACSSAVGAAPTPVPPVSPAPIVTPGPSGTPVPGTPAPTDDGEDAMPITVHLDTNTPADVYVDIVDRTGSLDGAATGHPAEGASIEPGVLRVENVDDRTLRLTWSSWILTNGLALALEEADGGLRFTLVLPAPTDSTDAMAVDHALVLTFDAPVSADDVEAVLQDGGDTAD